MQFTPETKHGVLVRPPSGKDFVAGINSPLISATTVLPSGDWRPHLPIGEKQQAQSGWDTDDCTGYSYTNTVEIWIKFWKANNLLNPQFDAFLQANGYYLNGEVNFSERALGSMAGTTSNGNYLDTVAETARTKGLVPESKWPSDPNLINLTGDAFYAEYYKLVPQELQALAAQFQTYIDLAHQVINSGEYGAPAGLTQGPLYIALCTCGGWSTETPVLWCNAGDATNHAVAMVYQDPVGHRFIFDSYPTYLKELNNDYNIPYLQQVIATQKKMTTIQGFKLASDPTVYIQLANGVLIPVASWPAFVELGGSTSTIKTLPDFTGYIIVKDVFLNK